MNTADLLRLTRSDPFIPFRIRLKAGKTYDIPHRGMVLVTKKEIFIGIASPGQEVCERSDAVPLADIAATEPLPQGGAR